MSILLIDDLRLGEVLFGSRTRVAAEEHLYTTGLWYVRLCQSWFGVGTRPGVLSRPLASQPPARQRVALERLGQLPPSIGLLSLRTLAPAIGRLREHHALNMLAIEALAAAIHLEATVYLSAPSPRLEAALTQEGVEVRAPSG